jgi:hypothetical protein
MTTDRAAVVLTQGVILHAYNIVWMAIVAVYVSPLWAIPQLLIGVGSILFGGSKK